MICELCNKKINEQPAFKIHDDDEDESSCDTCGSLAIEWPQLGWVCMSGKPLVPVGADGLYHPETVSLWRRLKWALV